MKRFYFFLLLLCILILYRNWLTFLPSTAGDWQYIFPKALPYYSFFPSAWNYHLIGGLGGNVSFILGLETYYLSTTKLLVSAFRIPWEVTEKLVWYIPFLVISAYSSYQLSKFFFKSTLFTIASALFYIANSYVLMLVGGGQMGVAIAYSLVPLVLKHFIALIDCVPSSKETSYKHYLSLSLITGLITAIQVLFDIRISYITLLAVFLYICMKLLFNSVELRMTRRFFLYVVIIPFVVAVLINLFWILPTVTLKQNPLQQLGSEYTTTEAVEYFSFAEFEQSFSLLHPYWPENIFGKVGFMRPEFLLLPILAYSSLLFLSSKFGSRQARTIVFFSLLGLVGAFLAKGANEPFGGVYLWMFDHIPGFVMFRDPTKWYTLTAISYSVLIPYSIYSIYEWLKSREKFQIAKFKMQINSKSNILNFQNLFLILSLLFLLFLIRPALLGHLSGTFSPTPLPQEYSQLAEYISKQQNFFRTLWIPTVQRFGLSSQLHPAISANAFLKRYDNKKLVSVLAKERELLQEAGVKYIIIPYDSRGEIFLEDRKYSEEEYRATVASVSNISWLSKEREFGKIQVFSVTDPKDHFWLDGNEQRVEYTSINPTEYMVRIDNAEKGNRVVFSDSFDPNWVMMVGEKRITSQRYHRYFNSFQLPQDGDYTVKIYYTPQKWVDIGMIISGISFLVVMISIVFLLMTGRKYGP